MSTKVYYFSRTGNTRKIAEAIAESAGVHAEDIASAQPSGADIVFLGAAVYANSDHKQVPEVYRFIDELKKHPIGKIAVFDTYAFGSSLHLLKDFLKQEGMPVESRSFSCKGKFLFFNRKHPDPADLENAKKFAREIAGER